MWYYSKNGLQMGPVSREELSAKANSGEVLPSDLVWREDMADWKPFSQVPEFKGTGGLATVSPQAGMGSPPNWQPPAHPAVYPVGSVPNYLWQSIVVTVLCCLPFGVVSIVHAAKVDSLLAQGDLAGAMVASNSAKNWALAGAISWLVLLVVPFVIFFVLGAGAAIFSP